VSLGSVICCLFLLLSFLVLPVQKTSRHYLSICLVSAIGLCCLSFIVPLGADPQQCHDAITPNDMRSDLACAFSGALVIFGGFASVMWIFLRSLSVFLQICFQIVPGKKFLYGSLLAGWGIPAIFLGLAMGLSGVSYRFGNICHINHERSLGTFWGPLLATGLLAGIIQFVTFGYCIRVYLRSVMNGGSPSGHSSKLQSFHGSSQTMSPRAVYRRVRKVIRLQWRGMMVIMLLLICVVYFAVVFIKLDSMTAKVLEDPESAFPWLTCIVVNGGDKDKCLDQAGSLILSRPLVMAVLFLIAALGYWCVMFIGRLSMITGWWDVIRHPSTHTRDFVSTDARRLSDPRNYEMLTSPPQRVYMTKGPAGLVTTTSIAQVPGDPVVRDFSPTPPQEMASIARQREPTPSHNFSHPRPLERIAHQTSRVGTSREGPAASPLEEWSYSPYSPGSLSNFGTTNHISSTPLHERTHSSIGMESGTSDHGRELNASRGASSPSLRDSHTQHGLQRSNSNTSRDWDPRATYARGGGSGQGRALSPSGGSNKSGDWL
jgi:hypothetical protein